MIRLLFIFLFSLQCSGAVHTVIGNNDNKSTIATTTRQTALFATLTNNSQITISCWVKYDWTDAGVNGNLGQGAFQGLVSKGLFDSFSSAQQFGLYSGSEKLGFSFANPAGTWHTWQTTPNTVQTNTWMHIACVYTYSNSASMAFYVNGTNVGGSWTGGSGNANALTNATGFHTFVYQKSGSSFFGGAMCELAIWTNSLLAGEIKRLASKVKYTT